MRDTTKNNAVIRLILTLPNPRYGL